MFIIVLCWDIDVVWGCFFCYLVCELVVEDFGCDDLFLYFGFFLYLCGLCFRGYSGIDEICEFCLFDFY